MSQDGYLTSLDYAEFKAKLSASSTQLVNTLGYAPVSGAAVADQILNANLSGDVSGLIANITVNRIQGVSVTTTSLTTNDILQYDGAKYVNKNIPACSGSQYLTFNGTSFSCAVDAGSSGTIASLNVTGPISSTGGTNPTLSIAQASSTTDGYLSSANWTTFNNKITSSAVSIAQVLGYVPASASAVTGLQSSLGSLAYGNSIDLGSASATGTISDARLANQADVVSGTQYTKVKVDGKCRVVSGAQLAASDVTTALGYTPASASASTQWNTSGTTINYVAGNVGIGTSSPQTLFEVSGSVKITNLTVTSNFATERVDTADQYGAVSRLKRSRGTFGSPTSLQSSDFIGELSFEGRSSTGYAGSSIDAEARIYARLDSGAVGFDNTNMATSIYFSNKTDGEAYNTTKMIINSSGNVGIGTIMPGTNTKLSVEGQIRSKSFSTASSAIDWANGNSGTTSHDCGSTLTLANIRDGGSYTLSVTVTGTTQCSFSTTTTGDDAATVTYRFFPTNAV